MKSSYSLCLPPFYHPAKMFLVIPHLFPSAELATSIKEDGVAPLQPQSYFVRLGSLSSKLRHRAYQHSLAKIKNTRQSIQETLSQLHQTIDLVGTFSSAFYSGADLG